jgi:hypothetical protein
MQVWIGTAEKNVMKNTCKITLGLFKIITCFMFICSAAYAELDSASQEALGQTKELLLDPKKRNEVTSKDPAAKKADDYAKSVGGEHTEKIYGLAAKVFEKLVIKYNGDSKKIEEVLNKASKDPAGFASSEFSEDELKALRELASQLPTPTSGPK